MDSYKQVSQWFDGMQVYAWDCGFVAFKGNEVVVFADGIGFRGAQSDVPNELDRKELLSMALKRFRIEHVNPTPQTIDAMRAVEQAIARLADTNPATEVVTAEFAMPGCRTIFH